ncbi:hypothetical protein EV182_006202 [Spiromyces aspiralis]|uniref:Uncharacterized protein n=1 Tax=Spiromyces aspiralis TaxID=68401 RepID=A0ACC1HQ23_9FUNG|nr:hypothetical protein EV182_006202 [Spiromyces aspiralis]
MDAVKSCNSSDIGAPIGSSSSGRQRASDPASGAGGEPRSLRCVSSASSSSSLFLNALLPPIVPDHHDSDSHRFHSSSYGTSPESPEAPQCLPFSALAEKSSNSPHPHHQKVGHTSASSRSLLPTTAQSSLPHRDLPIKARRWWHSCILTATTHGRRHRRSKHSSSSSPPPAATRRQYPKYWPQFCCCGPKIFVFVLALVLALLAVILYFLWPRMPSASINAVQPRRVAAVQWDQTVPKYGLSINADLNYSIKSSNYYPLTISRIELVGSASHGGGKVADTVIPTVNLPKRSSVAFSTNLNISYVSDSLDDVTLQFFATTCAPLGYGISWPRINSSVPFSVEFQMKLYVRGLSWARVPVITSTQAFDCPTS